MAHIDRLLLQEGRLVFRQEMVRGHPADHNITSLYGRFGIPPGIEYRWVIDHSYQHGRLVHAEVRRVFLKEGPGGAADAIYIIAERDLVKVEGQDLLFRKVAFEPDGNDPFFQLLDN